MDIPIATNPDFFFIPLYLISTYLGSRLIFHHLAKRRILKPLVFFLFINLNLLLDMLLYPADYNITYALLFLFLGVFTFDFFYLLTRLIMFIDNTFHHRPVEIKPSIAKTSSDKIKVKKNLNYLDRIMFWFNILLALLTICLIASGTSIGWGLTIFGWFYIYIPLKLYDKLKVNPPPPDIELNKIDGKFILVLKNDWAKRYDFLIKIGNALKYYFYLLVLPLTGRFPFSLIGRNKLGHYSHNYERKIMFDIENLAAKKKINLKVIEVENRELFINYKCLVKTKRKTNWQEEFTNELIKETRIPVIYLRSNPNFSDVIDVLVPRVVKQ